MECVMVLCFPGAGKAHGRCAILERGHYRRKFVRLGWNIQGSVCEGSLVQRSPAVPHKLSGALCSVSHPEMLSSIFQWASCSRENDQYDNGGLYQLLSDTRPGVDLLSRGTLLYRDWTLHPAIVKQAWMSYGHVSAWKRLAACPPVLISFLGCDIPHSIQSEGTLPHTDSGQQCTGYQLLCGQPWQLRCPRRKGQYFTHTQNTWYYGPGP